MLKERVGKLEAMHVQRLRRDQSLVTAEHLLRVLRSEHGCREASDERLEDERQRWHVGGALP